MSVEDNTDTQQLIERLLVKAGYDVVIADNGVMGLEMLHRSEPAAGPGPARHHDARNERL